MVKPDEIKAYTAYQSACAGIDKADLYSVNIIAVENRDEEIGESVKGIFTAVAGKTRNVLQYLVYQRKRI